MTQSKGRQYKVTGLVVIDYIITGVLRQSGMVDLNSNSNSNSNHNNSSIVVNNNNNNNNLNSNNNSNSNNTNTNNQSNIKLSGMMMIPKVISRDNLNAMSEYEESQPNV